MATEVATGHSSGLTRKLRYSERKQLAETGSLGALQHDRIPPALTVAVNYMVREGTSDRDVGDSFALSLHRAGVDHFGWTMNQNHETQLNEYTNVITTMGKGTGLYLDLIEIMAEEARRANKFRAKAGHYASGSVRYVEGEQPALPDFESRFNDLADRHRFGYRLEGGEIRRIGSPALADEVVGPALLAAQRPGWEQVQRSYSEALHHQRGPADENDDALTAAGAALEAALKAVGMKGNTAGQLAADFKRSDLAAPQLTGTAETLDTLLTRVAAVRNVHGDAHGKSPGDHPEVPQELVDLAIHLVGAFIVYLDGSDRRRADSASS